MLMFECWIPGRPPSKKNTKKVVRRYGRTTVIYSKQFREWEQNALVYLKQAAIGYEVIDCPLEIKLIFHFRNHKNEADVSNLVEAPQDALTKAGVITDDKIIQVVHAQKVFEGREGISIELYSIDE